MSSLFYSLADGCAHDRWFLRAAHNNQQPFFSISPLDPQKLQKNWHSYKVINLEHHIYSSEIDAHLKQIINEWCKSKNAIKCLLNRNQMNVYVHSSVSLCPWKQLTVKKKQKKHFLSLPSVPLSIPLHLPSLSYLPSIPSITPPLCMSF